MDPFVAVEYRGKLKQTTTILEGGAAPVWNQTLEFDIVSVEDQLTIKCFDEDVNSNDKLGIIKIAVAEFCTKNEKKQWINLMH